MTTVAVDAKVLHVLLFGCHAGILSQERSGSFKFEYDELYRDEPSSTPLSTSMSKVERVHRHREVQAFIWGLLPDNERVLDRWGREYGVPPHNPFALLSYVGEDCAGAVQFVREERMDAVQQDGIAWLDDDAELEERLRTLRLDPASWIWDDVDEHGRFSLAGTQAKTALVRGEDGRWGRPYGRTPTTHILKVASGRFPHQEIAEHLTMRTAALVGMTVARSELLEVGDERVIVVERYDRVVRPSGIARVHQEDLCQALSVMPSAKYQADGGPGPVDVVRVLRERISERSRDHAVERFVDALIFNWILGGTDAHAKNYSLLLAGPAVELSPLYDLTSAFPYEDELLGRGLTRGSTRRRLRGLRLAMTIGGEAGIDGISMDNWATFAAHAQVDFDRLAGRIRHFAERLPDAATEAGGEIRGGSGSPVIPMIIDGVVRRSRRALSHLDADSG